jgi:hypothetical protein
MWRHKEQTSLVSKDSYGITVGVLHTGKHYDDELDEQGGCYHYPNTQNRGVDLGDVEGTKNCRRLELPLFIVMKRGSLRDVYLGWVTAWDDQREVFFVEYAEAQPPIIKLEDDQAPADASFVLFQKKKSKERMSKSRGGQAKFRFQVARRYGEICALSGLRVPQLLDAAHIVPDSKGGTNDPRNGLMLSANLHRAFDRKLLAIHPESLQVVAHPKGPSLDDLGVIYSDLSHLPFLPARSAIQWTWDKAQKEWVKG